jgi:hypothetical protein
MSGDPIIAVCALSAMNACVTASDFSHPRRCTPGREECAAPVQTRSSSERDVSDSVVGRCRLFLQQQHPVCFSFCGLDEEQHVPRQQQAESPRTALRQNGFFDPLGHVHSICGEDASNNVGTVNQTVTTANNLRHRYRISEV